MSVVAGCSLFDGVLLAADCRATIRRRGYPDIYADNVQKLFFVFPHTAIGFVGDIDVASALLVPLLEQSRRRRRADPINFSAWAPRLFRREFSAFTSREGERNVVFMVASVLTDRENIVERQAVVDLVNYIVFGNSPIQRNFIPDILVRILRTLPQDTHNTHIQIPGTSMGMLYIMRSPNFEIERINTLSFAAIGSGESVYEEIVRYRDSILALEPGNSFIESTRFRETIRQFIDDRSIETVGGLYPAMKITGRGTEFLGQSITIPVGGTNIQLIYRDWRWYQRNNTYGREIMLLYPWEIRPETIRRDHTFNDLNIAFREFRGTNPE